MLSLVGGACILRRASSFSSRTHIGVFGGMGLSTRYSFLSFVHKWHYSAAMIGQSGDAMSIRSIRRSRIVDLRKPLVKSITALNSADIPPGIAILGGRSAVFNLDTDMTEGLCSSVVELSKPSVKSVTLLISANPPHGVANNWRKVCEIQQCYLSDRRFA